MIVVDSILGLHIVNIPVCMYRWFACTDVHVYKLVCTVIIKIWLFIRVDIKYLKIISIDFSKRLGRYDDLMNTCLPLVSYSTLNK